MKQQPEKNKKYNKNDWPQRGPNKLDLKISKRNWKWAKRQKNRNKSTNDSNWNNQDRKASQDIQKDRRSELKKIDLANFYIHNKFKYKTGIAMIKENNRLIRDLVIPKCIFDKRARRWRYYVQTMDEAINFRDFIFRNKDRLLKGKNEIRKTYNSYLLT